MSLLAQHAAMMRRIGGGSGESVDPFVAASHPTAQAGSTISAAVPAGAQAGDSLVMVVRVRGDRTVTSPPAGTATVVQQFVGSGTISRQGIYVFQKPFEGETSLSCSHSAVAAHGVSLYVVRGSIVNSVVGQVTTNVEDVAINKVGADNGLLAVGLVVAGTGFIAASPTQADWTQRGTDYYGATDYFGVGYSRAHSGAVAAAHVGAGVALGGSGNPNAVVILEISPP